MLPNVITKPPLLIPDNAVKRTLHVVLVASPRSPGTCIADHRSPTNAAARTLGPLLLEPASPALGACRVSIRCHRRGVLAPVAFDERRIRAGGYAEIGRELPQVIGVRVARSVDWYWLGGRDGCGISRRGGLDEFGIAVPLSATGIATPAILPSSTVPPLSTSVLMYRGSRLFSIPCYHSRSNPTPPLTRPCLPWSLLRRLQPSTHYPAPTAISPLRPRLQAVQTLLWEEQD